MSEKLMPGNICSQSGEYEVVGPRGGKIGRNVSMKKGDTFPPTPGPNQYYQKISK